MSKAVQVVNAIDGVAEAAISAKVPKSEQELKPWRSIIYWPEARRKYFDGRYRWVVPVACGVCRKRRDRRISYIAESEAFSDKNLGKGGEQFTGLCVACVSRRCQLETKLLDGSEVSPWEISKEGMPVVCGKCNTAQFLKFDHSVDIDDLAYSCISCKHNVGEQPHPKGAKVFWLNYWLKRALSLTKEHNGRKVPFACADCGEKGCALASHIWLKDKWVKQWLGLCSVCHKKLGHVRKITGDFCLIPSRSIVLSSRRTGKHVPIQCGLLDCGKEN